MKLKLFFLLTFCLLFGTTQSQNGIKVAKHAQTIFPEDKIISSHSSLTIEFKNQRKKKGLPEGIIALEKRKEKYINLDKDQQFTCAVFYDDYSKVTRFSGTPVPKIADTYYEQEGIFHSDARVKYGNFYLNQFGSEATFESEKVYTDLKYLTKVYFPWVYSSMRRQIKFIIPDNFEVELIPMNFEGYEIQIQEQIEGSVKSVEYIVKNIDNFSDESGMPGHTHIYPHVLILVKSFEKDGVRQELFQSTKELYDWYLKLTQSIGNQSTELNSIVEKLVSGATTEGEKIEKIYYWVQSNIRYIAFEDGLAGYQPESCQTVFHNRYGDCKGMANLTKEMLKIAGFDARLVWLGTRSIAYDYSIPSLATDNHMICAVKHEGAFWFLDATEKFMNFGDYAERIQGQNVLIENGDSYILDHVPAKKHHQNLKKMHLDFQLNDLLELVGTAQIELQGESRTEVMYYVNNTPGKRREELYKAILTGFEKQTIVHNLEIRGDGNNDKTLILKGNLTIPNQASTFDNETYLYIDPYQILAHYDFKEDRKFDYWFDSKRYDELEISFTIPQGWSLSSLPEALQINEEAFLFDLKYESSGEKIIYNLSIQIPQAVISVEKMPVWNQTIKQLTDHYEQPIILKKQ